MKRVVLGSVMTELEEGNALCRREAAWVFLNMCECGFDAHESIIPEMAHEGVISAVCSNLNRESDPGEEWRPSRYKLQLMEHTYMMYSRVPVYEVQLGFRLLTACHRHVFVFFVCLSLSLSFPRALFFFFGLLCGSRRESGGDAVSSVHHS